MPDYALKSVGGPSYFSLQQAIVTYLHSEGGRARTRDVVAALYSELGPAYFDKSEGTLTNHHRSRFGNDVSLAKFFLEKCSIVVSVQHGVWQLSDSKQIRPEILASEYEELVGEYNTYNNYATTDTIRPGELIGSREMPSLVEQPSIELSDSLVVQDLPSVPDDYETSHSQVEVRESIEIQSLLAFIGASMGMRVWIPRSDKQRVTASRPSVQESLIDTLPLNYDEITIRTIEQIDVLWLKGRSIVRAFEVEHTTSIYSGILRMADLMALQPNMEINLHIVAPEHRREKVFDEIRRPVFAYMERGPLAENCTYISYASVRSIASLRHLNRMSSDVIRDYAEEVE